MEAAALVVEGFQFGLGGGEVEAQQGSAFGERVAGMAVDFVDAAFYRRVDYHLECGRHGAAGAYGRFKRTTAHGTGLNFGKFDCRSRECGDKPHDYAGSGYSGSDAERHAASAGFFNIG